jgi:3-hydroxyacyl-[acyl-carrier-protein] dehydratase
MNSVDKINVVSAASAADATKNAQDAGNADKKGKILNSDELKDYLPHRYPFLLVDRVLDYEVSKTIHGIKNVTGNEEFFSGHFPGQAVMPGVLMIEALAQAAGVLYFLTAGTRPGEEWFYFAGIDNARFKRIVIPGDQLHLHVEMVRNKFDLWMFSGRATVDGELACSVDLKIVKVRGAVKNG